MVETSEGSSHPNDEGGWADEPKSPGLQPSSQQAAAERGSVAGVRVALWLQLAVIVLAAPWAYFVTLGLAALAGYTVEETRSLTAGFIAFVILPLTVHLLAAIQVGRTKWGALYLVLSMIATVVQVVMLLPLFVLPAVPFIVALIIELASLANRDTRARVEAGSSPRRAALPELIVIPLAIAVFVGLMVWNGNVNTPTPAIPDEPNPSREFDASEGWQRLEAVVDETLPALEQTEDFAGLGEERRTEHASWCEDGAMPGEEWVELRLEHDLGELEPDWELSLAYVESIRTYWPAQGYEITVDHVRENSDGDVQSHLLKAVRDDGITAVYDVGYGSASFEVQTGCILQPT